LYKDYPEHTIFSMPALSPTMEMGTISSWELKEGDSFSAGAAICSVETDKATMDFEAQDDGFIAKILREGSSAVDIAIGTPICVVVEDEEDVAAFADFTLEEEAAPAAAATSEPAAAAAPAAVAPAPAGRQVSDEYVLLPSARFLAESKYVFSIMFSYCLTYPIFNNNFRTVLEQRSRCNRLGRNSKGWPRNEGRCSSGDQEWNSNARSCNQNCTPGVRSCCCPTCSRHQCPDRGPRTSRD
jgi:hypothetical protein